MKSFTPGQVWPDTDGVHINAHGGGMLYEDGVYYWFGEHKIEGELGNKGMVGVHCYSSRDLYNWKNEGIALAVTRHDGPQTADGADIIYKKIRHNKETNEYEVLEPGWDIEEGCVLERPKVVYCARTRKYVMWFHLEIRGYGYGTARVGVAVSDTAAGPYRFVESFRPNGGESRDQTVYVDDDGSAYHFCASDGNHNMQVSLLREDYLRPAGRREHIFKERFMEAPALFKHAGKYWFMASGCTGWAPNAARSAVADSLWGPWTELGNPCAGKDAEITFNSQSTYILPVAGKPGAFIYMGDRWTPKNAIDGRYIWLPIRFKDGRFELTWMDEWDLSFFDR